MRVALRVGQTPTTTRDMDDLVEYPVAALDRRRPAVPCLSPEATRPAHRLAGRVALITGGDTSLGRATAILFAREGADVAFTHLSRHDRAEELTRAVEREGRACLALCGDLGDPAFCEEVVARVLARFGAIDVLINNLDPRHQASFFSLFYLTRRLLPHLRHRPGANIINTASPGVRAAGELEPTGAEIGVVTRSLAHNLAAAEIRVNAVAPVLLPEADARAGDLVFLASDETVSGELLGGEGDEDEDVRRRRPRRRGGVAETAPTGSPAVRRRRRARR